MRTLNSFFLFLFIQGGFLESAFSFDSGYEKEVLFSIGIGNIETSPPPFLDSSASKSGINLEKAAQDFVLCSKRIEIPEYPNAFNPSIVRWKGKLLLSFRVIPDRKHSFHSQIGLVWLDEQFTPIGPTQFLNTRLSDSEVPSRAEDARLLTVGEKLYVVYSDNEEMKISKGGFRMYVGELSYQEEIFFLENSYKLSSFEGESKDVREKNWVPFDAEGRLLFAYSLIPHRILAPVSNSGFCETIVNTQTKYSWRWGELRGGTPGLKLNEREYLAFFHSSLNLATIHSEGKEIRHYFMGAYTFSACYPYQLLRISPEPIIGKGFYSGEKYKPYWKPVRVVFPGGYLLEKDAIWVVFGKQDHEMWVTKIDRKKLLQSLVPISTNSEK